MSSIVIERKPGGAMPGTLHCDCGAAELAIWVEELGCRCSACGRCYKRADGRFLGPGTWLLAPAPYDDALKDIGESGSARAKRKKADPRPVA